MDKQSFNTLGDVLAADKTSQILEQTRAGVQKATEMPIPTVDYPQGYVLPTVERMQAERQAELQRQAEAAQAQSQACGEQTQFMIGQNGQPAGPFSLEQMQELVGKGELMADSWVWYQGLDAWKRADELPLLAPLFANDVQP